MKLNLRLPLFITLLIASVGIGTVGVHASTDCQHLFQAYKNQLGKHLHHKVSPETLARWAAWNKAHPHYRPTKKESLAKVDFACGVPTDNAAISQDLPPVALPPLVAALNDTFGAPSQPAIMVSNLVPPDNPVIPPVADPLYPPVYYPPIIGAETTPSAPSPTPEPASLVLMATACSMMSALLYWKRRQDAVPAHQTTRS